MGIRFNKYLGYQIHSGNSAQFEFCTNTNSRMHEVDTITVRHKNVLYPFCLCLVWS